MNEYDRLASFIEWLALPVVCFILLVLFLFFIVRPFFAYLFNPDRIRAVKKLREARQKKEQAVTEGADKGDADEEFQFAKSPDMRDDFQQINKLAESNPDKAGTLVKEWLKADQRK